MRFYFKYRFLLISIIIGIFVGLMDSVLDYLIFFEEFGSLKRMIFYPPVHEVFTRTVIFLSFVIFGIVVQYLANRSHRNLQTLNEQEFFLKIISGNINDMIWIGSDDWEKIYYVSDSYQGLWGRSSESLKRSPLSWMDAVIEEDKERVKTSLRKIIEEGLDEFKFPLYRIKSLDGNVYWLQVSGKFVKVAGEGKRYVVGVAQNVTNQIRVAKQLKDERDYLQKLLNIAGVIIVTLDSEGNITLINRKGQELIGKSWQELAGKNWFDTCIVKEKRREVRMVFDMIISGKVEPVESYENTIITDDGRERLISWHNALLYDEEGNITGTISSGLDVTGEREAQKRNAEYSEKLKRLVKDRSQELDAKTKKLTDSQKALTYLLEDVNEARQDLIDLNKKLELSNKELEAFSYSVSHDLKAPLRAIDGFSKILLEEFDGKLGTDGERYLKIVRDNTQRMGTLIQDLLNYSRVGRVGLKPVDIDMYFLVRDLCDAQLELSMEKNIVIEIDTLPKVKADKTLITQVWNNLLSNAVKFSSPRETPKIKIGFEDQNDSYRFFISDNGVGFDKKYANKLFQVFQRLHTIEEFEGTGVGLALVKRIVERHGGSVDVEAKKDNGATFYFSLAKR